MGFDLAEMFQSTIQGLLYIPSLAKNHSAWPWVH